MWKKGEPIVDIYGTPTTQPMRIIFAEQSRIIVPEEDRSLTLYTVNKQSGENPLQTKTLWFFAQIIIIAGGIFFAAGGATLLCIRKKENK